MYKLVLARRQWLVYTAHEWPPVIRASPLVGRVLALPLVFLDPPVGVGSLWAKATLGAKISAPGRSRETTSATVVSKWRTFALQRIVYSFVVMGERYTERM